MAVTGLFARLFPRALSGAAATQAGTGSGARNVLLLLVSQSLFIGANMSVVAFAGLAGSLLAPTAGLATLPVTATILANAGATAPMSLFMARFGRRAGFRLGSAFGAVGGLVAAYGVYAASFWLLFAGMICVGPFLASAQYYRFAAGESVTATRAPRAISLVLIGGLFAALAVPSLAAAFNDYFRPYSFMGVFLLIALLALLVQVPVSFYKPMQQLDTGTSGAQTTGGRPLSYFLKLPAFWVAVVNAALGYAIMSFVMTATPIAMVACGFDPRTGSETIQGHVIAMYLPSLFTGILIQRVGLVPILLAGHGFFALSFTVALAGIELMNFSLALILLGLGWNFCFISGTTLLTRLHGPLERGRVQGFNETLVFGCSATASFAAGLVLTHFGWAVMNRLTFVLLAFASIFTLIYSLSEMRKRRRSLSESHISLPQGEETSGL